MRGTQPIESLQCQAKKFTKYCVCCKELFKVIEPKEDVICVFKGNLLHLVHTFHCRIIGLCDLWFEVQSAFNLYSLTRPSGTWVKEKWLSSGYSTFRAAMALFSLCSRPFTIFTLSSSPVVSSHFLLDLTFLSTFKMCSDLCQMSSGSPTIRTAFY